MKLGLNIEATKFLLSSSIPGNPNVKKAAAQMADRIGAQFALYLDKLISDSVDGDKASESDVIKVLKDNGLDNYIDAFKAGVRGEDESDDERTTKKGKETKRKK